RAAGAWGWQATRSARIARAPDRSRDARAGAGRAATPTRIALGSWPHGTGRPRPAPRRPRDSGPGAARNARYGPRRAATRWSASAQKARAGLSSNHFSARRRTGWRVNGACQLLLLLEEGDEPGVDLDLVEQSFGGATTVRAQLPPQCWIA